MGGFPLFYIDRTGGMMKYITIKEGIFLRRPNRFIAYVLIDGHEEKVHVKNTGRCKELLIEGAKVILEEGRGDKRKTKYSLIAVWKGDLLINMDSQAPNKVVEEALLNGKISEIGDVTFLKRETVFGDSRLDFYFEKEAQKGFIEVKGITLEENGIGKFPDAPTQRGVKHLYELMRAVEEGYQAYAFFVVQLKGVHRFCPNTKTDPEFTKVLQLAHQKGVQILVYDCSVTEDSLVISEKVNDINLEEVFQNL